MKCEIISLFYHNVGWVIEHVVCDQFLALVELQPSETAVLVQISPRKRVWEFGPKLIITLIFNFSTETSSHLCMKYPLSARYTQSSEKIYGTQKGTTGDIMACCVNATFWIKITFFFLYNNILTYSWLLLFFNGGGDKWMKILYSGSVVILLGIEIR